MTNKLHTSLRTLEIFSSLGQSINLQPYILSKLAIALETNFIGRHLHAIFKEGYNPRKCYYTDERPSVADVHLVKFQMTVPRKCHKHVCSNEQ